MEYHLLPKKYNGVSSLTTDISLLKKFHQNTARALEEKVSIIVIVFIRDLNHESTSLKMILDSNNKSK